MPKYLLREGSSQSLILAVLGILACGVASSLGEPAIAWASLLFAYLGTVAYLAGGAFTAYLAPGVLLFAGLPLLASLAPRIGYAVAISFLGAAAVLALVRTRTREVRHGGCEYCDSYVEKRANFCDYCGRRLPGLVKLPAPGRKMAGLFAAGLVLVALSLNSSVGVASLLGSGLSRLSAGLLQAGGGVGAGTLSGAEFDELVFAALTVATIAGLAKKADMTNARRFDGSLGLDERDFATFASLAHEGRGTGAELLNAANLPGGWAVLQPLLERLARLGLMRRQVVNRRGSQTMLWKSSIAP